MVDAARAEAEAGRRRSTAVRQEDFWLAAPAGPALRRQAEPAGVELKRPAAWGWAAQVERGSATPVVAAPAAAPAAAATSAAAVVVGANRLDRAPEAVVVHRSRASGRSMSRTHRPINPETAGSSSPGDLMDQRMERT